MCENRIKSEWIPMFKMYFWFSSTVYIHVIIISACRYDAVCMFGCVRMMHTIYVYLFISIYLSIYIYGQMVRDACLNTCVYMFGSACRPWPICQPSWTLNESGHYIAVPIYLETH